MPVYKNAVETGTVENANNGNLNNVKNIDSLSLSNVGRRDQQYFQPQIYFRFPIRIN